MRLIDWQRAYAAHDDPAANAANVVALVVAWNGPLYPIYVVAVVGWQGLPAFVTVLAAPFFYAIPWVARRNSLAGRTALPLIGIVNSVWCMKLFGTASEVQLFLLPCIILAALLFRSREVWLKLLLIGAAILPLLVPDWIYGTPLLRWSTDQAAQIASLNLVSVAALLGLIALQYAKVLSRSFARTAAEQLTIVTFRPSRSNH